MTNLNRSSLIPIFLFIASLISCRSESNRERDEYESFFYTELKNKKNIEFDKIDLDSIILDKVESSNIGTFGIFKDSLFFVDKRFCYVFIFDKEGHFISKNMGQGRGPKEIPIKLIDAFAFLENGSTVFFGTSWDVHIFDKNWNRISGYSLDWNTTVTDVRSQKNPSPSEPALYTLQYGKIFIRPIKDFIYFPIISGICNLNPYSSRKHYTDSRVIGRMDLKTGKVVDLMGRRSPIYLNYRYIGQFSSLSFDITNKNQIYVCQEPDSLIYVYDLDFNIQYKFGFSGKNMNTNYTEYSDPSLTNKIFKNDRRNCGYYDWIEYIDEKDILFRSYKKGSQIASDGLQIYKDNTMIADIEVPKNFRVTGFIKPYFYSNEYIDENLNEIKIYRFRLSEN